MLCAILCVAIGLSLCGDVALAGAAKGGKSKKGKTVAISGKVASVDADGGTLTVTVNATGKTKGKTEGKSEGKGKGKTGSTTEKFSISVLTTFEIAAGGTMTTKTGKDGLRALNVGASVTLTTEAGGAVINVAVGGRPNGNNMKGPPSVVAPRMTGPAILAPGRTDPPVTAPSTSDPPATEPSTADPPG